MLPVWEEIRSKSLICIDEAYPEPLNDSAAFFPVDRFMIEAARWVVRTVPLRALGAGKVVPTERLIAREDGSGELPLPQDFLRLIRFRMRGWRRPVIVPIQDADARYMQQFNPTLRGGEFRPVVVLCDGTSRLEYFSSADFDEAEVAEAYYFGVRTTEDEYPWNLRDVTAWKVAELVLSTMNDAIGVQVCAGKINEYLQLL